MKVLIVESDSCLPFYGIVQDILSTSEVRFIQLSADSIIEEVERYTLGQSNEDLVIITSIRNRNFLLAYCTAIKRKFITNKPRLLVITGFETWSSPTKFNANNILDMFSQRVPLLGYVDQYCLENEVFQSCFSSRAPIYLLAVGLMYGKHGYHLESMLNEIWNENMNINVPSFVSDLSNYAPIIHCKEFGRIILNCIQENYDSSNPCKFIPCMNVKELPIKDLFVSLFQRANGTSCTLSETSLSNLIAQSSEPEWVWNVNIELLEQISYCPSSTVNSSWDEDWKDFLVSHDLFPCQILISGCPQSGKSSLAEYLSMRLELQKLDLQTALKFVLFLVPFSEMSDFQKSLLSTTSLSTDEVKKELMESIEQKLNESKKGKKGEEVKLGSMDLSALDLSTAFTGDFSPSLLRKCLVVYMLMDGIYRRKGAIFDFWGSKIMTQSTDVSELLLDRSIDLWINIDVNNEAIIHRAMKNLGIADTPLNKAPKDAQAAIKTLEGQLSQYSSTMFQECQDHLGSEKIKSLKIVSGELSLEDVQAEAVAALQSSRGPLGWQKHEKVEMDQMENASSMTNIEDTTTTDLNESGSKTVVLMEKIVAAENKPISSPPATSFEKMNHELQNQLPPADLEMLRSKCDLLQEYLAVNVMPVLASGMVQIVRDRPEDPIQYLSHYLREQSILAKESAEKEASSQFYRILEDANARYRVERDKTAQKESKKIKK